MTGVIETALAALTIDEIVTIVTKYGPAVEALIQLIEKHEDEKKRAEAMKTITRGLQYAKETGDTTQLEGAIRDHIGSGLPVS